MDFNTIYQNIRDSFELETGMQVFADSDLSIRMKVFAGELFQLSERIRECEKQMFPQTATGEYLARHGQCRDLIKKRANAASGVLRFSRSSEAASDIYIPTATLCTSSAGGGMMYATQSEAVIPKGQKTAEAPATAQTEGGDGNITQGKIDTIVSTIAGVDAVTNPSSFSGGREDEDDEVFRSRLLDSYINVSNGANLKFYEDFAMKHQNVTAAKAVFVGNGNQLDLYVTDFFRMIGQSVLDEIQAELKEARELNINVAVKAAEKVTLDVDLTVYVRNLQNYSNKIFQAEDHVRMQMYDLGVGEAFNPYCIGAGLRETIDGIVSIAFTKPDKVYTVSANQIISPGNMAVTLQRI